MFYRRTGTGTYTAAEMTRPSGETYQGTIPANVVQRHGIDYYILATDGQTTSSDPSADPINAPYIADTGNHRIRRVDPNGITTTIAGNGETEREAGGFAGDGGPAVDAKLKGPVSVAIAPDKSAYIVNAENDRIRRMGPNGIITTIAGTGAEGFSGDNRPATGARLNTPTDVAVGPDGSVYITDTEIHRIRRVAPDSTITTFAGSGIRDFGGDGGPATDARLKIPPV